MDPPNPKSTVTTTLSHNSHKRTGPHLDRIEQSLEYVEKPAPDGGYGWIIAICIGFVNGNSWGIAASYSVFLAYYIENDTFPSATKLHYACVGSLGIGTTLILAPLGTVAVRELGTRPTMLLGSILQTASLICASLSTQIWHLFLSQGALFGIGMGLLFIPSVPLLSHWFTKRRALASGIAIAGAGLGGLIYSLSAGAMLNNIGLAWALRTLAIVSFVATSVSTLLIRDRYAEVGALQLAFDLSLLRRPSYLLFLGFGFFSMLGYFVLVFTLANYADYIGLNASQRSFPPALFMLGQAIGRPVMGFFSDRIGHINMTTFTTIPIAILALAIWVNAKSFGVLITFVLIEGLVAGVFWVTAMPVMAEVIGVENLPSGLTMMWLGLVLPSMFSAPIALEIYDRTGSYLGAQLFTSFMFVVAAFCIALLRAWKIGQVVKRRNQRAGADEKDVRSADRGSYVSNFFSWERV